MATLPSSLNEYWSIDTTIGRTVLLTYITLKHVEELEREIEESRFNASINHAIELFDYQKILRNLVHVGYVESGGDSQSNCYEAIGFLQRTRSREEFDSIVDDYIVPELPGFNPQYSDGDSGITLRENISLASDPPPYSAARGTGLQDPEVQSPSRPEVEICRYSSRLWEEGASSGQLPTVNDRLVRAFPARYQTVVTFRGMQGEGEASTKKLAKHIASKNICQRLGIIL